MHINHGPALKIFKCDLSWKSKNNDTTILSLYIADLNYVIEETQRVLEILFFPHSSWQSGISILKMHLHNK